MKNRIKIIIIITVIGILVLFGLTLPVKKYQDNTNLELSRLPKYDLTDFRAVWEYNRTNSPQALAYGLYEANNAVVLGTDKEYTAVKYKHERYKSVKKGTSYHREWVSENAEYSYCDAIKCVQTDVSIPYLKTNLIEDYSYIETWQLDSYNRIKVYGIDKSFYGTLDTRTNTLYVNQSINDTIKRSTSHAVAILWVVGIFLLIIVDSFVYKAY